MPTLERSKPKSEKKVHNINEKDPNQQSPNGRGSLLAEYSACNDGYNNRDVIVFWEYSILIAIFSGLIAAMAYISDKLSQSLLSIVITIMGILGFLSLLGISIDMRSAHSCKVAIRERMKKIEEEINNGSDESMELWSSVIEERDIYPLENWFKFGEREKLEKEIDFLNLSTVIIIALWILIVIAFIGVSNLIYCKMFIIAVVITFLAPKILFRGGKNGKK